MRGPTEALCLGGGSVDHCGGTIRITRSVFFIFVFLYAQVGKVASNHFRRFSASRSGAQKATGVGSSAAKAALAEGTGRTCGRMRGSENSERLNERTNERAVGRSVGRAGGVSCSVSCEASRRPPSPCRNTAGDIARAQHSMTEKEGGGETEIAFATGAPGSPLTTTRSPATSSSKDREVPKWGHCHVNHNRIKGCYVPRGANAVRAWSLSFVLRLYTSLYCSLSLSTQCTFSLPLPSPATPPMAECRHSGSLQFTVNLLTRLL